MKKTVAEVVKKMQERNSIITSQQELRAAHQEVIMCIAQLEVLLELAQKKGDVEQQSVFNGCIQELEKVEDYIIGMMNL